MIRAFGAKIFIKNWKKFFYCHGTSTAAEVTYFSGYYHSTTVATELTWFYFRRHGSAVVVPR